MRNLLTLLALCALALGAQAQCTNTPPAQLLQDRSSPEWIRTAKAAAEPSAMRQAVAEPSAMRQPAAPPVMRVLARDDRGLPAGTATVAQAKVHTKAEAAAPAEEHPRRSGPAMLLAVLAVMTGIALRRAGASDR
jgi:hypothetical protein